MTGIVFDAEWEWTDALGPSIAGLWLKVLE